MPVRSLSSSVLAWPDRTMVEREFAAWAKREAARHPELVRIGFFGSYARGDWGVGSDLDLIAIVRSADARPERRSLAFDVLLLPVPVDLLVYTEAEWAKLGESGSPFARTLEREVIWLEPRESVT